jgi:murein DD-endopeptidase / murein LD-carboxypeptidase
MIEIPAGFMNVYYDGAKFPGSGARDVDRGANCQLFAYALLGHFGVRVPPFRSSELWSDTEFSQKVTELEPLDVLLYNRVAEAHGAHVAVYVGDGCAVHLSKHIGRPEIWPIDKFLARPEYAVFVGAKRIGYPATGRP